MEVAYVYTKLRSEFGKPCNFSSGETQILESILPTDEYDDHYVLKKSTDKCVSTIPVMSETYVNTDSVVTKNTSMCHTEGGWPKDVDFQEQSDVTRFRKKAEKDDAYLHALRKLVPVVERCMKQNNTVDIYEHYFEDKTYEHSSGPPSAKGLAVFRDPSKVKRAATSIDWHTESTTSKIAVSYSITNFQDERFGDPDLSMSSYIWDISNSNRPLVELSPSSHLTSLRFNPKNSDTLVGGCYNGQITYFDIRKPNGNTGSCLPLATTTLENSHHDPVSDVFWISSKTGHQAASVSTDGKMMWWDTRNLIEPLDSISLYPDAKNKSVLLGGSCLEYNSEAGPTKYLVGTEQGTIASINLRNRKLNNGVSMYDEGPGSKHHGPVHSIYRNPIHNKFFLSVGDWTTKVWAEDVKSPIINTSYNNSYLTGACWSPTRAGVFYTVNTTGTMTVWDLLHRQNEAEFKIKIGDRPLSSIALEEKGKLVAVGDSNGTVTLHEVSHSLSQPQKDEKTILASILDRETRRLKSLETKNKSSRKTLDEKELDESDVNDNFEEIEKLFQSLET